MAHIQYEKTKIHILNIIEELKHEHISVLPTEQMLVERLNVGRNMVRMVVGELVEQGVVERIQGKGTFITNRKNELVFSNWIDTEISPDIFMKMLMKSYQAERPDISIQDMPIPYHMYVKRVFGLFANGSAPDVVQLNPYWLRRFQKQNLLLPLDSMIGQDIIKRRYPAAVKLCQISGELFAINWTLDPLVLYYNKVVLEKAGLRPDSPPETLDELVEMSVKVNQSVKNNLYGFCLWFDINEYSLMCLYPLLLSFGGGFADSIGNVIINSQENIDALNWLSTFYEKGGASRESDYNGARMLFASDRLAFLFDGPFGRGNLRQLSGMGKEFDSHYGVAKIPIGPSGKSESVLLSHCLAISKYCQDPAEAYKWIEFLAANEENAKLYYEAFGMIPCNRNYLQKPFFINDPFASVLIDQIDSASIGPVNHPLFQRAIPFMLQIIMKVILEKRDPEEQLNVLTDIVRMIGSAEDFGSPV